MKEKTEPLQQPGRDSAFTAKVFRERSESFDRYFRRPLAKIDQASAAGTKSAARNGGFPVVDVFEYETAVVIRAELPGVMQNLLEHGEPPT